MDSDDEPLLGQGKRQEKAKDENNMAMFVRLLLKLDQDRKEDKVWKRKLDLKLEKFQKEDGTWKQEMELKINKLKEDLE